MDPGRVWDLENEVLSRLGGLEPQVAREALYEMPPWRVVAWARIACSMGVMPRAERDGIVREAANVGRFGRLKPWDRRTERERECGVRGPGRAPGGRER